MGTFLSALTRLCSQPAFSRSCISDVRVRPARNDVQRRHGHTGRPVSEIFEQDSRNITNSSPRHPLQTLCEATFVPNDAYLVGGCGDPGAEDTASDAGDDASADERPKLRRNRSILVCTGPNACGKVTISGLIRS